MKVISCIEAVKKIFELMEGKLTSSEKKQLDEHLSVCRECCDRLDFERLLKEKLQKVNKDKKLPQTLTKRINTLLQSF